jgi:FecR-like protein
MRKVVIVLTLLLLPSALFAQASLKVSQVDGKVEWRAASSKSFVTLVNQPVQSGDEIRTGPGANLILMVPDGSYMVVHENSRLVVEDFWSGNFKSMVNLMLGQVRFYIQRIGGRPNPYSVRTPTALIAVRGTTFDVMVDDSQFAEVRCIDGRVTVENLAMGEREVILEPGFKTLVRPGEYPMMPVRIEDQLNRNRLIAVRKVNSPDSHDNGMPSVDRMQNDNDRRNRPLDPVSSPSRTNENTQRAKPGTLSFP